MKAKLLKARSSRSLSYLLNDQLRLAKRAALVLEQENAAMDAQNKAAVTDFRLVVSCMRDTAKLYFNALPFTQKAYKLLRDMTDLVGPCQEAEIAREWLATQDLAIADKVALHWLDQAWKGEEEEQYRAVLETVPGLHKQLRKHLKQQLEPFEKFGPSSDRFNILFAATFDDALIALNDKLSDWQDDHCELHAAYREVRRMVHLFEPLAAEYDNGTKALRALNALYALLREAMQLHGIGDALPEYARQAVGEHAFQLSQALLRGASEISITTREELNPMPGFKAISTLLHEQQQQIDRRIAAHLDAKNHREMMAYFAIMHLALA